MSDEAALETVASSKLLVSVRDPSEISIAMSAEIDIIDLKEPRDGPLAPAGVDFWRHAATLAKHAYGSRSLAPFQLSAALGERADALRVASHLPAEFSFAKVGPSGCEHAVAVGELWSEIGALLKPPIELVAVAYADARRAACPSAAEVFRAAADAGIRRCLVDTFVKDGRSTLDHLGIDGLKRLADLARDADLWWVLAGSINASCVSQLSVHGVRPDCFGVRGDVCDQGRTGTLSPVRIKQWRQSLGKVDSRVTRTNRVRSS